MLSKEEKINRAAEVVATLEKKYPSSVCALQYEGDPWKLLVMGRLSAQCTDARVNIVCEELFRRFPDAESMAGAPVDEIERLIFSCGVYKVKAQNIKEFSAIICERFGGHIPDNMEELLKYVYENGNTHFQEMSGGQINATELIGSLICRKETLTEGIQYVQELVDGSMTLLIMTKEGIYAARDLNGRTPVVIGKKEDAFCVSFENFAYLNLGYEHYRELGPGEIVYITPESVQTLVKPREKMKICSFLWVYYGYPTSSYEGVNVEEMRYNCGSMLAKRDGDSVHPDIVAGVPDSGVAHAIGYANESGIPYARPFIKYTPTWPRSFMPTNQSQRDLIARMKLIPVQALIENKRLLLIDDSIVRGTQLRETTEFLYRSGAKEVHVRPACPPLLYGCKYLNFSRSKSELELITRRVIREREGDNCPEEVLEEYTNPDTCRYAQMIEDIRRQQNFTTLRYHRLDDLLASIGIEPCKVCTYCFDGKE